MAINELTTVVAPPKSPIELEIGGQWDSIQDSLKIRLPDDIHEFGQIYGSGSFVDNTIRVVIFNPFSPSYAENIQSRNDLLEAMKVGEGDSFVPFDVFPKTPGLLAWGEDDNGNQLFWFTKGPPNDWNIVVRSGDGVFQSFEGPMSSFLARAFQRRIRVDIWPDPFFPDATRIHFEPEQKPIREATEKNVYELYIENGNSAGFWVRKVDAQPGFIHFIKTVNGRQSGTLPGIPTEFGRPRVHADVYLDGELFESNINLSSAFQSVFLRVPEPSAKHA